MTRHKDFKALVRARMRRTGENYLTARAALLAEPIRARTAADGVADPEYEKAKRQQQVIVDRWFHDGRLIAIPARRKVRAAVLLEVLSELEPGRIYPEVELSRRLGRLHEDYAYLRRELVAFGYLEREAGRYWVCTRPPSRSPQQAAELPTWERIWLPTFIRIPRANGLPPRVRRSGDRLNRVGDSWVADSPLLPIVQRHRSIAPFVQWGRIASMPTEPTLLDALYAALVELFDPGETLTEAEIGARIAAVHDDPAEIRRALVDRGLLARSPGSAVYRRLC